MVVAVGPVYRNLSDVVDVFKSAVTDFKGCLSKCLSLILHTV